MQQPKNAERILSCFEAKKIKIKRMDYNFKNQMMVFFSLLLTPLIYPLHYSSSKKLGGKRNACVAIWKINKAWLIICNQGFCWHSDSFQ